MVKKSKWETHGHLRSIFAASGLAELGLVVSDTAEADFFQLNSRMALFNRASIVEPADSFAAIDFLADQFDVVWGFGSGL
jgi:hypothetical protein